MDRVARQTVLLVEDDAALRSLFCEALEGAGFGVVAVESAEEALLRLESPGLAAVVSDLELPGASGIELLRQVRSLRPELATLAMSASAPAEPLPEGVSFVSKPLALEILVAAVRAALTIRPS